MVLTSEIIPSELLRSFLVIQRTGSYTEAAEFLGVSQPAISAHMKRLQQLVGGELFERGAGVLLLTERGETVKHYASRILNLNSQMLRQCGVGGQRRTFRIGIQNVFAPTHLVSLQDNLERRLGQDRSIITWGMGLQLCEDVSLGYLDAAFVVRPSTNTSKFDIQWDEEMCWVCAPNFVLGEARPIPLLSWPGSLSDTLATAALSRADTSHSVVFVAHDLTSHVVALRAGLGMCILPRRLVPPELKIAEFHFLPQLPFALSGVLVNEGIPEVEARLLRDAIGEVMRANAPLGPDPGYRLPEAALI
jgi:DNA-binding transcriptional LysR family regulator